MDDCDCDQLDFAAAKALNEEGLSQFSQDRTAIAALNDRLVRLIELVRDRRSCFRSHSVLLHHVSGMWKKKPATVSKHTYFVSLRPTVLRRRTVLWNARLQSLRRS